MTLGNFAIPLYTVLILVGSSAPHPQVTSVSSPTRDPVALSLLQNAIATSSPVVAADSSANGTVTIVTGQQSESGRVTVLTRGVEQTFSEIRTTNKNLATIFSNGLANTTNGTSLISLPMESSVSSQCLIYPIPFIVGIINNPDWSFQYVAEENTNGVSTQHIQVWNSFLSHPKLQFLSAFTLVDIWFNKLTNLPFRISYFQRSTGGASPRIQIDLLYADYRTVSGNLYPFSMQQSVNGTPWASITIESVVFNSGLTDSSFPVQ